MINRKVQKDLFQFFSMNNFDISFKKYQAHQKQSCSNCWYTYIFFFVFPFFLIFFYFNFLDVRDVARAHILALENETATGRYLAGKKIKKIKIIKKIKNKK